MEEVIIPANNDFASHDRIRRSVGDGRDVNADAFSSSRRVHSGPAEHPFEKLLGGAVIGAAAGTVGAIG